MIEKKINSKVKKVWLLNFFKNQKMKNFRDHFFSINFWVDSNNSKIQKSANADFAYPPFSKISTIEKKFNSKVKKNLLLIFFKISKMKNFRDHFFRLFLPFFAKNWTSFFFIFWFLKKIDSQTFSDLLSTFFSIVEIFENDTFFLKIDQKTPFSLFFTIQIFFDSKSEKVWLSTFFKITKMKKNRDHFLKFDNSYLFWKYSKTPFSLFFTIQFFFDSKSEKVWLSTFFKIAKMKKNQVQFLPKKWSSKFVIFWFLKKIDSQTFSDLLSTFFSIDQIFENDTFFTQNCLQRGFHQTPIFKIFNDTIFFW